MAEKSVLLSTKSYPPVVGGSAFLLYELLRHFPEGYFEVVHGVNDPPKAMSQLELPFNRKQVKFLNLVNTPRAVRYIPRIYIQLIVNNLQRLINQGNIKKVYAHYPNGLFLYAAYKVAVKNNLPLIVYFDILWEELSSGFELSLAKKWERKIFDYADNVIAITEFAADYLSKKHNRKVNFIPHTVDISLFPLENERKSKSANKTIHFAGGIHDVMNTDSVLRIVDAIEQMNTDLGIEFYSPDLPDELLLKGYMRKYVNKHELVQAQRNSSILLLPQAFNSSRPSMIQNNFPTKTMEYVCSGVPILVHSPRNSYLTYLAKKEGFGYVVDIEDTNALIEAIHNLQTNDELRNQLVQKAFEFAKSRDSKKWAQILKSSLD